MDASRGCQKPRLLLLEDKVTVLLASGTRMATHAWGSTCTVPAYACPRVWMQLAACVHVSRHVYMQPVCVCTRECVHRGVGGACSDHLWGEAGHGPCYRVISAPEPTASRCPGSGLTAPSAALFLPSEAGALSRGHRWQALLSPPCSPEVTWCFLGWGQGLDPSTHSTWGSSSGVRLGCKFHSLCFSGPGVHVRHFGGHGAPLPVPRVLSTAPIQHDTVRVMTWGSRPGSRSRGRPLKS